MSIKPYASRSSHSRPIEPKKVTVSALHIKLNFNSLKGININLKQTGTPSSTTTKFYYYETSLKTKSTDQPLKSIERHMIFFDGKCRNCQINAIDSTIDSGLLVNPTFSRSIKCHLRANSCVNGIKIFSK